MHKHQPSTLLFLIVLAFTAAPAAAAEKKDAPAPAKVEKKEDAAPKAPPAEAKPIPRQVREVEGWKVHVDERLLTGDRAELGKGALRVLEIKLFEASLLVAKPKLADLRTIEIVLDYECPRLHSLQYHPSAGWLKSNGHEAVLTKKVHIPRAAEMVTQLPFKHQPMVMLHELSHGFHDQFLSFDHAGIMKQWEAFKASGKWEKIMHISGRYQKHYALTTQMEFFAEMSESYFGTNDFYPFVRGELKEALPEFHELLAELWGDKEPKKAAHSSDK